jgi:hypothetical protein
VLSDSREGRRKKQPEQPDPKAFERFEALARKILPPSPEQKRSQNRGRKKKK